MKRASSVVLLCFALFACIVTEIDGTRRKDKNIEDLSTAIKDEGLTLRKLLYPYKEAPLVSPKKIGDRNAVACKKSGTKAVANNDGEVGDEYEDHGGDEYEEDDEDHDEDHYEDQDTVHDEEDDDNPVNCVAYGIQIPHAGGSNHPSGDHHEPSLKTT